MRRLDRHLGQLWAHEKASYGLRVFIALTAAIAYGWYDGHLEAIPGLFLGIIASAIAETDDNWWGRTKSVLLSLLCFVAAAAAVIALFPYPVPFISALALTAFGLTLLGALGERYASIGQATVTLAIYAMIAMDQHHNVSQQQALREVIPLLVGASWYGLLSILWTAMFANRPVRERLARLFFELGHYLQLKADLFEPVRQGNLEARRLALAEQNVRVVQALNIAKTAILSRFGRSGRPGVQSGLYFRLYYMAQDFHERASSSHYPYEALTEAFFHSDVLYRCRRLLTLQGQACTALGQAIRLRQPFDYGERARQAGQDLQQSLRYLREQPNPRWRLLGSLQLLETNLSSIARQLSEASLADTPLEGIDTRLRDSSPHTLREMATRLRQTLTPGSLLFRHGVRIALALTAGYALLKLVHPQNGYWILLTIVFVCRPHFGATRLRLVQRVAGTLLGLGVTWALMQLFPGTALQLLLALAAALLFFVTRNERYVIATAAITLMALLCFNLLGDNGLVMIWPRLLDTLLGGAIAVVASLLILPDWQGRRLHRVMAQVVATCTRYLDEVLGQYRSGMRDDLPYRIARRDMHNADVALSVALANMLREPGYARGNLDAGFRFLALSNTLLGYLSALGAHRAQAAAVEGDPLIEQGHRQLRQSLAQLADALEQRQPATPQEDEVALADALEQLPDDIDDKPRLVRTQLALMLRLLPKLRAAAAEALKAPLPSG